MPTEEMHNETCIPQCLQDTFEDTFRNYLDKMMTLSKILSEVAAHLNTITITVKINHFSVLCSASDFTVASHRLLHVLLYHPTMSMTMSIVGLYSA